jgi:hypothetical protein
MSENTLNNLNSLENKIFEFGSSFVKLLEKIRLYLKGKLTNMINDEVFERELDNIINNMILLKEELHKRVEEVYKENNLVHMSKLHTDLEEQYNSLIELKLKMSNLKI